MALSGTTLHSSISGASGNFGTGDYTTASFTPASSSLLVIALGYIENSGSTSSPLPVLTITDSLGVHLTYTARQSIDVSPTSFPSALRIYTAPVTTGAPMTLTVGTAGRASGFYSVMVRGYTGYDTSTPVGVGGTTFKNGGFGSPPDPVTITLSGTSAATSEVFAGVVCDRSAAGVTEGSGWTEIGDTFNSDWGGLESEFKAGALSTADWVDVRSGGGAIFNYCAAAIEINAAAAATGSTSKMLTAGPTARPAQPTAAVVTRPTAPVGAAPDQPLTAPIIVPGRSAQQGTGSTFLRAAVIQASTENVAPPRPLIINATRLQQPGWSWLAAARTDTAATAPDGPCPLPLTVGRGAPAQSGAAVLIGSHADPTAVPDARPSAPIVTTALVRTPAGSATVDRPQVEAATRGCPTVVIAGPQPPAITATVVLRSSFTAPLVAGDTIRPPLVVAGLHPSGAGLAILRQAGLLAAHSCDTTRPSTGITARPGSGTTAYVLATTVRPTSGMTIRPDTGITIDPC